MAEPKSYHVMAETDRVPVEVAVGVLIERDASGCETRFLMTSRPPGCGWWRRTVSEGVGAAPSGQ